MKVEKYTFEYMFIIYNIYIKLYIYVCVEFHMYFFIIYHASQEYHLVIDRDCQGFVDFFAMLAPTFLHGCFCYCPRPCEAFGFCSRITGLRENSSI